MAIWQRGRWRGKRRHRSFGTIGGVTDDGGLLADGRHQRAAIGRRSCHGA
jgi:hypothetical protein